MGRGRDQAKAPVRENKGGKRRSLGDNKAEGFEKGVEDRVKKGKGRIECEVETGVSADKTAGETAL